MAEHEVGQLLTLTARFRNAAGDLTDPDVVTFTVSRPGTDWPDRETLDDVTHDSAGVFHAEFVPDQPGRWWWAAVASGTVAAAGETSIDVRYPHAHG